MTEDLCLDSEQVDPLTILVAQYSGGNSAGVTSGPTATVNSAHVPPSQAFVQPSKYQFAVPFGSQPPQYGPPLS